MNIFIGSSDRSRCQAERIKRIVQDLGIVARVWYHKDIFVSSSFTLENLERAMNNVDAAIIIWTNDRSVRSRNKNRTFKSSCENIIFETGLFIGNIGKKNVCILKEKNVAIPTDLSGITTIDLGEKDYLILGRIREWLKTIDRRDNLIMNGRSVIERHYSFAERWKYAREITFVNFAASTFLIPEIAPETVYPRKLHRIFIDKLTEGTQFRFVINRPGSAAAEEAAKNKIHFFSRAGIHNKDIFKRSLEALSRYSAEYGNLVEYRVTDVALPYASMSIVNDEHHRYLDHIKIDLYSAYISDPERRSFILYSGDKTGNYDFFRENIINMWANSIIPTTNRPLRKNKSGCNKTVQTDY